MAKPFLKWAGGKRQLIGELESRLPPDMKQIKRYCEPFLGGGAFLFHVLSKYEFETVYASDINSDLILCYNQIKYTPSKVNKHLQDLVEAYPKSNPARDDFYYAIRDSWNSKVGLSSMTEDEKCLRVAQTIFLNKTCFNGLFRLNSKGEFNVPTGRYVNPAFPSKSHIEEVSKAIQNVVFQVQSYESVIQVADQHTLVYFDPPYRPISKTSSSNIYTKVDFDDNSQIQLAEFVKTLDSKGVQFLLSNSDPMNFGNEDDFFDELYSDFRIERVLATRAINSNPNSRGSISELLISNY